MDEARLVRKPYANAAPTFFCIDVDSSSLKWWSETKNKTTSNCFYVSFIAGQKSETWPDRRYQNHWNHLCNVIDSTKALIIHFISSNIHTSDLPRIDVHGSRVYLTKRQNMEFIIYIHLIGLLEKFKISIYMLKVKVIVIKL